MNHGSMVDLGMDCEWYAVDSLGQIAFFTTAGAPYMPEWYWPKPQLLPELAQRVQCLPAGSPMELLVERQKGAIYSSWTEMSHRGIFGYDYDWYKPGYYRIMSRPIQPIWIADADMGWGKSLPFYGGQFGRDTAEIKAEDVLRWLPVIWP